jgi:hypothetical protein
MPQLSPVLLALLLALAPVVLASYGYAVGDETTPMCWAGIFFLNNKEAPTLLTVLSPAAQLYGPAAKQQVIFTGNSTFFQLTAFFLDFATVLQRSQV